VIVLRLRRLEERAVFRILVRRLPASVARAIREVKCNNLLAACCQDFGTPFPAQIVVIDIILTFG